MMQRQEYSMKMNHSRELAVNPNVFHRDCVSAEKGETIKRPSSGSIESTIILNCLNDVSDSCSDEGNNPIPRTWIGGTGEKKCKGDKIFACKRSGENEVKCTYRVHKKDSKCKDDSVDIRIHALCC